ncbi:MULTISPECIES: DUF6153 family protein [Microbacterium]|uniref:DUF6153 family protein n=1 Tax=Microbacterium schleiferi TaxID=69362 RepID=A0ABU7V960_9MICO|nr:hypothetical protein [Micrococcales bacterium]
MSLIALARRVRGGDSVAGTLLLVVGVTVAVIIGLLAMHALNAPTASGHLLTSTVSTPHAHSHHDALTAVPGEHTAQAVTDESCEDCAAGGHSGMLAMACVLALLVTALLLRWSGPRLRWLSVLPRPTRAARGVLTLPPRPPSLISLCISRT